MDSAGYRIRVPCDAYCGGHLVLSCKQKKNHEVSQPSVSYMNSRKIPETFHLLRFSFTLCYVEGNFMFPCFVASFPERSSNCLPIKSFISPYIGSFPMAKKKENKISSKTRSIWLYSILMVTREGLRSLEENLF